MAGYVVEGAREAGRRLAAGAIGGLACGLVIGGIGGRLAMFLLRLTSGRGVVGLESDDGFTIGAFTASTMFLLVAASALGAFAGMVYALARGWLPDRIRHPATALLLALVGGAATIHPGGVDFTVLSPRWLAVALFVLLPGTFGFALSRTVDRLLRRPAGRVLPWVALASSLFLLVVLGFDGVGGMLVLAAVAAVCLLAGVVRRRWPDGPPLASRAPVVWAARTVLVAAGVAAAVTLFRSVTAIL
ncbi:MAG: hypothetical protein ACRDJO_09105 [Actinomycetota bacterium]